MKYDSLKIDVSIITFVVWVINMHSFSKYKNTSPHSPNNWQALSCLLNSISYAVLFFNKTFFNQGVLLWSWNEPTGSRSCQKNSNMELNLAFSDKLIRIMKLSFLIIMPGKKGCSVSNVHLFSEVILLHKCLLINKLMTSCWFSVFMYSFTVDVWIQGIVIALSPEQILIWSPPICCEALFWLFFGVLCDLWIHDVHI